ncbi:hypothetical protein BDV93DRAFT_582028 [Ceratobasidium sp. AG-I]|nr:hypothetical protein BDV93DRAFT_582028 [Ceratobasidium sp. AG-I]
MPHDIFPSYSPQPQYCKDFTARPAPNPSSLAAVSPVVFPNINTQISPKEKRSGSGYSDDSVSNMLILGRNGRHEVVRSDSDAQQSTSCWSLMWRPKSLLRWCTGLTSLRPGRFYVSNVAREGTFLSQAGFSNYETEESLSWSTDPAFSLDHLLVLASSFTSLSRFRYASAMQSPDWYPMSLWEAIRQLPTYIESEEPAAGVVSDNVLLTKTLAKHPDNMRKYRNRSEDSDRGVSDRRQREIEMELDRSRGQIELQKLESRRLGQERDALAQEQREMKAEIEKLRRKLASDVYPALLFVFAISDTTHIEWPKNLIPRLKS